MTVQTFRDLLTAQPFQPFRITMSSGKQFDVKHPEMAFLSRTILFVGVDIAEDGVPAEFRMCSLLHITAVELLSAATVVVSRHSGRARKRTLPPRSSRMQ